MVIFGHHCNWAKVIPVVLLLLLFAGCQGLAGNPGGGNNGSVTSSPTALAFGNVQVGSNASLSETVTNTGGSTVTISQANISNAAYSISGLTLPAGVAAGKSLTFTVKFAPSAAGSASGNLTLVSDAANSPLTIPLSGNGVTSGHLSANPTSLAFGNVQVGSNASLSETVTNTGGSTVTISQANISNAAYSISGLTLPANLSAGQSVTFTVKFAPSAAGTVTANLTLVSNADNSPLTIPLSGTGVTSGHLSANPTSLAFGNVQVGSNASLSETVANTGGSTVTISQANISNAAYSISGLTLPANLSAGQSVTFTVKFAPSAAGTVTANLTLVSNADNSPLTIPLSGTGVTSGHLSANPTSLAFGNVQVGSNASLSETVTNTGGSTVTISQANISNAAYSISGLTLPANLSAGQSVTFNVTFAPGAAGSVTANLTLVSNADNSPLTIPLSGTGVTAGHLSANPTSLAFGNVQVGSNASLSETVTNTGGSTVTISSASVGNAAFSISGLTLPANLSAGQSVTFNVTFAPSAAGSVTANLTLVSNADNSPLVISLSGTGTTSGQLGVSPASLGFGDVVVGASSTLGSSLSATGAAVTVSSATSTSPEFTISGLSLPAVLAAGQSLPYSVTFTPQATGTATATLTFISNASNSPTQQTATGNGLPPPQHSVGLSWSASDSQGVVGYNVYRGGVSGGPYSKINTSLDAGTNYTDNQVVAGQTYYYVATAVDGNGDESGYSNEVPAVIPQP